MKHVCPSCGKNEISLRIFIQTGMPHGGTCPACGSQLRIPLSRRIYASIPIFALAIWVWLSKPSDEAGIAASLASIFLALAIWYISPLKKISKT